MEFSQDFHQCIWERPHSFCAVAYNVHLKYLFLKFLNYISNSCMCLQVTRTPWSSIKISLCATKIWSKEFVSNRNLINRVVWIAALLSSYSKFLKSDQLSWQRFRFISACSVIFDYNMGASILLENPLSFLDSISLTFLICVRSSNLNTTTKIFIFA